MSSGWEELLDELERRVDAHGRVLNGQPALEAMTMPTDLGEMPGHLHHRARHILERQQELEAALVERMANLKALAAHWSHHADPLYLDQSV